MDDATFIPIGRVVKAHGLNGELSVRLEPVLEELPLGIEVWFVPPPAGVRSARVHSTRQGPKGLLASFEGIDDIDTASTLRGLSVVARPEDLPPEALLPTASLEGYAVADEARGTLGEISEIIHTGANDVWVVEGGPFGQVLVPVIDDVIVEIDDSREACLVRLLPGLIEDEA